MHSTSGALGILLDDSGNAKDNSPCSGYASRVPVCQRKAVWPSPGWLPVAGPEPSGES